MSSSSENDSFKMYMINHFVQSYLVITTNYMVLSDHNGDRKHNNDDATAIDDDNKLILRGYSNH